MSHIKSESLFSYTLNHPYQFDTVSNESASNIFKSIMEKFPSRPQSALIASIFQIYPSQKSLQFHNLNLIDKLATAGNRDYTANPFHFNWSVCKNQGFSQEQNSQEENQKISRPQTFKYKLKLQPNQGLEFQQFNSMKPQTLPFQQVKKVKNETKNIPKNYGKAIISFIEKNRAKIQIITDQCNVNFELFFGDLKRRKKSINTIADLRMLWSNYEYAKCMRIISRLFLRKYALAYIFDSRICTFASHIKYRQRLSEALQSPQDFRHIKDY